MKFDLYKFITNVQQHRVLWDVKDPNHESPTITKKYWIEICRTFHKGYDSMPTHEQNILSEYQTLNNIHKIL